MTDRLLRMEDVVLKTSLPRSTITTMVRDGEFPAPLRIGKRACAYRESEIDAWIDTLPRTKAEAHV